MDVGVWVIIGLLAFNAVVFGLMAIIQYFEDRGGRK